jgi:hypothetical protein
VNHIVALPFVLEHVNEPLIVPVNGEPVVDGR